MPPTTNFPQLTVWQKAHQLTLAIYTLSSSFPKSELYGLTAQLRRAAVSVPANIAEGSLEECRYYLILAKDLNYAQTQAQQTQLDEVARLLNGYTQALLTNNS